MGGGHCSFRRTCMRYTCVHHVWLTPAENLSSLLTRSAYFTHLRAIGTDVLKGPGRISSKSCQETEGRAEWSILHVGIAGKDYFLTWFMKTLLTFFCLAAIHLQ